jgi:hypothetical protein
MYLRIAALLLVIVAAAAATTYAQNERKTYIALIAKGGEAAAPPTAGPTTPPTTGPTAPPTAGPTAPPTTPACQGCALTLVNGDKTFGLQYDDLLSFHTAVGRDPKNQDCSSGTCLPAKAFMHEVVTLTLRNTGTGPLQVEGLPIVGPWQFRAPPTLPFSIPAGQQRALPLQFVGECNRTDRSCPDRIIYTGTLTVQSNDGRARNVPVALHGIWQPAIETGEPRAIEIGEVFGFRTSIPRSFDGLDTRGRYQAIADEVLSPRWERADTSKPTEVLVLAAFHGCCTDELGVRLSTGGPAPRQLRDDAQTILPRNTNRTGPVQASYTPNGPFVVFMGGYGSDRGANGDPHALRFFPLRDRNNVPIANAYLVAMDLTTDRFDAGEPTNYDYQDMVMVMTNIRPVGGTAANVLRRINVGDAGGGFTDPQGNRWDADTGLFSPNVAREAPSGVGDIAGTNNDQLYRDYRGQAKTLTFNIPVNDPTVGVRLHFAELFWGRPGSGSPCSGDSCRGRRLFNIAIEGRTVANNVDIYALAGGATRALVLPYSGINTGGDGSVTITLTASQDFPSIAGIEVLDN